MRLKVEIGVVAKLAGLNDELRKKDNAKEKRDAGDDQVGHTERHIAGPNNTVGGQDKGFGASEDLDRIVESYADAVGAVEEVLALVLESELVEARQACSAHPHLELLPRRDVRQVGVVVAIGETVVPGGGRHDVCGVVAGLLVPVAVCVPGDVPVAELVVGDAVDTPEDRREGVVEH